MVDGKYFIAFTTIYLRFKKIIRRNYRSLMKTESINFLCEYIPIVPDRRSIFSSFSSIDDAFSRSHSTIILRLFPVFLLGTNIPNSKEIDIADSIIPHNGDYIEKYVYIEKYHRTRKCELTFCLIVLSPRMPR
jgi:hypothetical protein